MRMPMRLQKNQVSLPLIMNLTASGGSFDRSMYSAVGYTDYEAILIGGSGGKSGTAFGDTAHDYKMNTCGGGGGGCLWLKGKLSDLPEKTPVTIGQGGANGADSGVRGKAGDGATGGATFFGVHSASGGGGAAGGNWSIASGGSGLIFTDVVGEGGPGGGNSQNLGNTGQGARQTFANSNGDDNSGSGATAGTFVNASPVPGVIGGGKGGGGGKGAVDIPSGRRSVPSAGASGSTAGESFALYGSTTAVVAAINAATTIAGVSTALAPIGTYYGCSFSFKTTANTATSGPGWTALTSADLALVKTMAIYYAQEFAKYPKGFVLASGLSTVNLSKTLLWDGVLFSGSTGGAYSSGQDIYESLPDTAASDADNWRRVIHHEFWHVVDGAFVQTMNTQEPAWRALNGSGYFYTSEGGTARTNQPDGHPIGFIDAYAQTSYAEDRAQIHSALMAEPRYDQLKVWMSNDAALSSKVSMIKTMSAQVNSVMSGNYWDSINAAGGPASTVAPTAPGDVAGTNNGGGGGGANAGVVSGTTAYYGNGGTGAGAAGVVALKIS